MMGTLMREFWALLFLVPLLVQDDPVAAEALKGYQHPWAGFGDGSSATIRETIRRPDIDATGNLVYKDVASEVTWTVIAAAGEKTTFKLEGGGQESFIPFFTTLPNWARGRGEKKGTEEISVGGVKRTCQITTISLDAEKDAGQVTTISKSPEVPYWAVRWRVETLLKGRPNTSEEELVLDVGQKLKVGNLEVLCVVVQGTVDTPGGARLVKKEWRSDEVPGRVVKRESRQYVNGKEIESAYSQMEVVRFRGKR
jgi:hypothetical protein